METTLNYLSTGVMCAVVLVLLAGLWVMVRGKSPNLSQKLMRWRVGLQFVAVILLVAYALRAASLEFPRSCASQLRHKRHRIPCPENRFPLLRKHSSVCAARAGNTARWSSSTRSTPRPAMRGRRGSARVSACARTHSESPPTAPSTRPTPPSAWCASISQGIPASMQSWAASRTIFSISARTSACPIAARSRSSRRCASPTIRWRASKPRSTK